jgi:hypothetical protein
VAVVATIASACSFSREDDLESSSSPLVSRHDARRDHDGGGGGACAGIGFPVIETTCPYQHGGERADKESERGERKRADEPTCKGWACRIEFPTPGAGGEEHEQYWNDSDGVHPEIAGCHQEWRTDRCADHQSLNGHLAEGCVGDLLIETNPGAGVCHPHDLATMGEFKG